MSDLIQVVAEPTPNPNSLKFSWGKEVTESGPYDFSNAKAAAASPLATKIFKLNGVMGVFIARDFITVTKHPGVAWEMLQIMIQDVIRTHVQSGEIIIDESAVAAPAEVDPADIEARIRKVLDEHIRPAVAMDGGDIHFVGFNAGVVLLQLKGACSGCPSSMATLKMGVENRLRQEIPEVLEVAQIM